MPKAQKRRKAPARASSAQLRTVNAASSSQNNRAVPAQSATDAASGNRRLLSPRVPGPQSLIFPGMVALGCWGMAYTISFLTTDPNRYLIGGMAALIALLWTISFGLRVRKLLLLRQRSRS